MLKKILKYTFRTLLVILLVLILVPALLYIPAVQDFVRGKAVGYASRTLGMDLSVERLRLSFPLRLSVDNTLLTDKGDGKFTFIMPAGKVEVKATFTEEVKISPFRDVPTDAYYYEAVKWAQKKGITGGIGDGLFGPNQPCTRAQIVTFLWRAAGSPEPEGTAAGMTDVAAGSYYEKAVAWAIENGITTGTADGRFAPDATCTRAQGMTFLFRASKASADGAPAFSDVAADAYYAEAVKWATDNGITNGTTSSTFSPGSGCTRAQIVTFLWRLYAEK